MVWTRNFKWSPCNEGPKKVLMTSAMKMCPWNYLCSYDSVLTHLDVPVVSGMHWRDGWLGAGRRVVTQKNQSWLASGVIKFITLIWRISSSLGLYSFQTLKSELLVFEVFEARFIWLISSCIQQILIEHLLCANGKDHKARPFGHCRPPSQWQVDGWSHTGPCEVSEKEVLPVELILALN